MYEDLKSLRMTPCKSKTLQMPSVPDTYFHDFVRGYFDGDGNVYSNEYRRRDRGSKQRTLLTGFTCGSRDFLRSLHERLKKLDIVSGGSLFYRGGYSRLHFSVRDSCKLYAFMYNTLSDLYLARKKSIFEDYIREKRIVL